MNRKKICFISLTNVYLTPYINDYLQLTNCDYDIIYWNRHNIEEKTNAVNTYAFEYFMDENNSKIKKLKGYFKFKDFAINIIKKNSYDGVILLQTSIGILLSISLNKCYKKKYIIDIRDYTMEKNKIFYEMEKYLFKNAKKIIISSSGYKHFLPKNYNYIIAHNSPNISQFEININRNRARRYNDKIRISCIGLIRFNEQNKKVIHKFANDDRFVLNFFGKNAMTLKEFCQNNNYLNVNIIDQFPPEKTLEFYRESDIINNLYGNNSMLLDYALSNKLYYAAKLGLPILVCPDTYMEKVAVTNGFGFCFDINSPTACDDLFNYYKNIDWNEFYKSCDAFNEIIEEENNTFKNSIMDFFNNI